MANKKKKKPTAEELNAVAEEAKLKALSTEEFQKVIDQSFKPNVLQRWRDRRNARRSK